MEELLKTRPNKAWQPSVQAYTVLHEDACDIYLAAGTQRSGYLRETSKSQGADSGFSVSLGG